MMVREFVGRGVGGDSLHRSGVLAILSVALLSGCMGSVKRARADDGPPTAAWSKATATDPCSGEILPPDEPVDMIAVLHGSETDPDMVLRAAEQERRNCGGGRVIEIARMVILDSDAGHQVSPAQLAHAWRLVGVTACVVRDLKLASDAYRHLSAADRRSILRCCRRQSLNYVDGEFRFAE